MCIWSYFFYYYRLIRTINDYENDVTQTLHVISLNVRTSFVPTSNKYGWIVRRKFGLTDM